MNAGMVLFGAVLNNPFISTNSLSLFAGNLGMAMSSQIKGQLMEVESDKKMNRTKFRPLPSNRIEV